jgi:hypothetical protein
MLIMPSVNVGNKGGAPEGDTSFIYYFFFLLWISNKTQ